jgi:glycerol-3-phosphate dehydrogenase
MMVCSLDNIHSSQSISPAGQHNDSQMNIALIMTAVQQGAVAANHVEVTELLKTDISGKLYGAKVRDTLTGEMWSVRAKV